MPSVYRFNQKRKCLHAAISGGESSSSSSASPPDSDLDTRTLPAVKSPPPLLRKNSATSGAANKGILTDTLSNAEYDEMNEQMRKEWERKDTNDKHIMDLLKVCMDTSSLIT